MTSHKSSPRDLVVSHRYTRSGEFAIGVRVTNAVGNGSAAVKVAVWDGAAVTAFDVSFVRFERAARPSSLRLMAISRWLAIPLEIVLLVFQSLYELVLRVSPLNHLFVVFPVAPTRIFTLGAAGATLAVCLVIEVLVWRRFQRADRLLDQLQGAYEALGDLPPVALENQSNISIFGRVATSEWYPSFKSSRAQRAKILLYANHSKLASQSRTTAMIASVIIAFASVYVFLVPFSKGERSEGGSQIYVSGVSDSARYIVVSPDDRYAWISEDTPARAIQIDLSTGSTVGEPVELNDDEADGVSALSISRSGDRIAAVTFDAIVIFDTATRKITARYQAERYGHPNDITFTDYDDEPVITSNGHLLASASQRSLLDLSDEVSGSVVQMLPGSDAGFVTSGDLIEAFHLGNSRDVSHFVAQAPYFLAADASGSRLYCYEGRGGGLSTTIDVPSSLDHYNYSVLAIIDSHTHALQIGIRVRDNARAIAVSPDGEWVYLLFSDSRYVDVLSTSSHDIVRSIDVGKDARSIALSADGKHLYVLNRDGIAAPTVT